MNEQTQQQVPATPKTVEDIQHLSKSSIEKYMDCSKAYQYKYILETPHATSSNLVFGVAFHDVVEQWIDRKADPTFDVELAWEMLIYGSTE
jgi:ATP-dependent helicase/DNAse subunit B